MENKDCNQPGLKSTRDSSEKRRQSVTTTTTLSGFKAIRETTPENQMADLTKTMPQLALHQNENSVPDLSENIDLNPENPQRQHPENSKMGTRTPNKEVNARNSLLKIVGRCKRMDNPSCGRNNSLDRGFAENIVTRKGSDDPEEQKITFPKIRGIKKKLASSRAIRMKNCQKNLWSGANFGKIRSSESKGGNHIIRVTAKCSVNTRERSQKSDPEFNPGFKETRSAILKLRDPRTSMTNGSGDGVFSFSRIFNQFQTNFSRSEIPESQAINNNNLPANTELSEVHTSKLEVFPKQDLSVLGPLALSCFPAEKQVRRGDRESPASPWDFLTAYHKPRFAGAVGDRRVNEANIRDGSRNRTWCRRRKTVEDLRILKRRVVMMPAMKERKKKKGEKKKKKRIMILKNGRKCRSSVDATLNENWNEGREKQGRGKKRKGEGIIIIIIISNEVGTTGESFEKERRARGNESELHPNATNSKDPIGRKVTSISIITGCHQQKQHQQFHEKCRKQPTAPELTLSAVVLIILPLFLAAGRWLQPRRAWKRLLQLKGSVNVKSTNSCSHVLTYPCRQIHIFFPPSLSYETVFILLLLKLSSSLLLLIPFVSLRYHHLKYEAQNSVNSRKHYHNCLKVFLRRYQGFGNYRSCVSSPKFFFNRFSWTPSTSSFMNTVLKTNKGVSFDVTNFQQLRPRESYLLLYYLRNHFDRKGNPHCDNKINNNNRANNSGQDNYLDHHDHHFSRVAKRPSDENSRPPILKIKPNTVLEKRPDSKISPSEIRKQGKDENCENNDKNKTFSFTHPSVNVTTCAVCDAYDDDDDNNNNTHPHLHRRDKNYRLFYAEESLLSESFKPGQSYLHQLPKCYDCLNNNTCKIIIRKITDGVILRSGGCRSWYELYKKKVVLYNSGKYVDQNNPSSCATYIAELHEPDDYVVTIGQEDELGGIVTFFPIHKSTGPLTNIRLLRGDNSHFRPDWGLVYCDTKMQQTVLALYEKSNVSWTSKYYEIQKNRPQGNKVSHSNQREKEEEKGVKGERKKRNSIVLKSLQTQNWRLWSVQETGTPSGANEKLSTERTCRFATTRSLKNTEPRKGITISTTTTYERDTMKSLTNCIDARGIQSRRRRRRRLFIVSSWKRGSSSSSGGISSRSSLGDRESSTGLGSQLAGVNLVYDSLVPELRESKDSQATVDAQNRSFEHHTGNLPTTIPSEWTLLTSHQRRARMETTSPGIFTQIPFFYQLPELDQHIRDTDNVHTIPHNSTTYNNSDNNNIIDNNNNSSEPLNVTNNDIYLGSVKSSSERKSISTNRANDGPLQLLATRRLPKSHQSELSSKAHEKSISTESENTSISYTVLSRKSPCSNSRSSRHYPSSRSQSPLSLHHHQHNNHHQKQQQQHSAYQHNNNNNNNTINKININISYYYDYYCDYIKKFANRFTAKNLSRLLPNWGKTFLGLLLIFQLVGTSMLTSALPVPKKKQLSNEVRGMDYLTNFGYVSGPSQEAENLMSESVKIESIKRFQMFADLPVTGIFDHRTMQMMEKPRCGNSDKPALAVRSNGRSKRYILSESHWGRTNLTFRFLNYTPDINFPKIRKAIYDAFLVWSRVTHLTFTEIMFDSNNGKDADIRIQFAQRYHNDGYPFDGEGIILAHAFFPGENKGGDTHFDDDEHWTVDSDEGVNLFMVAAHEFGHALGLSHSKTPGSLMYPWYQGKQSKGYQLPQDDVNGIQELYGVKNGNETIDILVKEFPDEFPDTKDSRDDDETPHGNCTHTFDAITKIRGDVYIFKGKYFWRWTSGGLKDSKPIPISHFWYQFPEESIDAVFERKRDSKIMFFKGDKYWLYDANHMERGWPLEGRPLVELGLPGDLKKIDAAFTWSFNKRTYLVSNDMYWKFDEMESYMVYDYPRAMTIWQDVPTPLDAAFQFTDNKTYFIKGKYYWEYEDQKMRVKSRVPTGNIAERWMQCPSEQKRRPKDNRFRQEVVPAGSMRMTEVPGLLLWTVVFFTRRLMA